MIRRGIVVAVDEKKAKVRVKFDDLDGMVSDWLPVVFPKTHRDKAYWLPDIGELVVVAFDEDGERVDGYFLGAIYNRENTPPVQDIDRWHVRFKDGTTIEYDRSASVLLIDMPSAGIKILAQSGTVFIDGELVVSGNIYDLNRSHGSLDALRQTYNAHTHTGDSGGTTSSPNQTVP